MNKKRLMQIVLPIAIVLIIAGIWVMKNTTDDVSPMEITEVDLVALKSYGLPVMLDLGSDSCGPCREMAPALKAVYEHVDGKAIVRYVDVWKYPDAAGDIPLQVIPTQIFFTADGEPYVPSEDFNIPFTMYSDRETGEHLFTVHEGGLSEAQMKYIFMDMGVDIMS